MVTKNETNEIHIIRVYDAPVKMVWDAWTVTEQVAQWWGPRGFTITTHSKDVRTGGSWNYTMHGPDGVDYPNKTKFLEVEKYSRMVYDHGANDHQPPLFRVAVQFSEISGKTTLDMRMTLPSVEEAAKTREIIRKAGGNSTWDRLAEYLSPTDKFVINRTFDAPKEMLFKLWTDPKHLEQWVPPTGFAMRFIRADINTGGTAFYCMSGADGMKMYGGTNYKEISKPDRIVYTQVFSDENGKVIRHPASPTWPETMLTTVLLTAETPDRTRVTLDWTIYGESTAAERETFNKAKGGMMQGWTGSFDKLEEYIYRFAG